VWGYEQFDQFVAGAKIRTLRLDFGVKFDILTSNCVGPIFRTFDPQKLTRLFGDPLSMTSLKFLIGPAQFAPVTRMYSK
jgi:hypothetical protein